MSSNPCHLIHVTTFEPAHTPCVRPKTRKSQSIPLLSESRHQPQQPPNQPTHNQSNNPAHPITDHIIKLTHSHAHQILHRLNTDRNHNRHQRSSPFRIKPIHNRPKRHEQPDIIQDLPPVIRTAQKSSV